MKKTHIPNGARTYCGRPTHRVKCINLQTTAIDEATCQTCQRSDDRRVLDTWQQELFDEGYRAFKNGVKQSKCPYDLHVESQEAKGWLRGWLHAAHDLYRKGLK